MSEASTTVEKRGFQAEVKQVLDILKGGSPRNDERARLLTDKNVRRVDDLVCVIPEGYQQNREQKEEN